MANRFFFTLAIVSLAITSVFSYGYPGYPTRDSNVRQTRRCPNCPADCPESLSSPWYGSPTVYGQPISIAPNNRDFAQQSCSFTGQQNYRRETPNSRPRYNAPTLINANTYAHPLSGELDSYDNSYNNFRCPYANCNVRSARSEDISSTHKVEDNDPTLGFVEPRGFPDDIVTSPSYSLQSFRDLANIFQTSLEHQNQGRRISRHYGNYKNPEIGNSYEKSPNFNYEDRIKAIETPSQEKVYVVYRADADRSVDNEEFNTLPMTSARQHQQPIQASHGEHSSPMSDSQLEEVVRRAIAAATQQNRREAALYRNPVDGLRGIDYNEHQREGDEILYNPRRPYNDELYRRFNPDAPIDWQESSKTIYGHAPSEVSYAPDESFYPDEEYLDTNIPNISRGEQMILEDNNQENNPVANVEYDFQPEVTGWEGDAESTEDVEKKSNDSESQEEKKLAAINEQSKETGEAEKSKEEKTTEEIEVKIPLANYRTHSRLDDEISSKSDEEKAEIERSSTLPSVLKNDETERMMSEANSDFIDEMESPPIATESTLRLNFENLEASTPLPID